MPLVCWACDEPIPGGWWHWSLSKPSVRVCVDCAANGFSVKITNDNSDTDEQRQGDSSMATKKTDTKRKGGRYYVGEWREYTREEFEKLVIDGGVEAGESVGLGSLKPVEFERVQPEPVAVITVPELKRVKGGGDGE